ncbi:MAG: hypothetical protein IPP66_08080 [Anaerolineales bacterium]|nr:hypothetical protein [Anaerolineales bacterium]
MIKIGLILFVIFGTFFEMIFSSFSNLIFPILLILLGAYLVLNHSGLLSRRKDESSTDAIPPVS